MTADRLEARTREIGREIFRGIGRVGHSVLSPAWWDDRMMALTMRDEAVKVQLFRLVDTLPALSSDVSITRHLREYFATVDNRLPLLVRRAIDWISDDGWRGGTVARLARFNATRLARKFIAGTTVEETLATIDRLRDQSLGFTIDLLGEAVLSEAEADQYQRQYLQFIEGITSRSGGWKPVPLLDCGPIGPIPRVNVSVKLSSLYSQFDPIDPAGASAAVRGRLRPILRLARKGGAFVNIDMEQFAFKDTTLRIFMEVLDEEEFRTWPDVGIAVQAYLKSCTDDLQTLADWAGRRGTPVSVRLVKGAYWDYETVVAAQQNWPTPVWEHKSETDANFERQTDFLIAHHRFLRPAIGSHNVRSIAHALAAEELHNLPSGTVEFQMLYGMADPIKKALVSMGRRVRVYTPFGKLLPGMAYLVRRLLENTSNQSFLRAGFLEKASVEELLMNPNDRSPTRPVATLKAPDNHHLDPPFRNEPLSDFSVATTREAMQAALRDVAAQLGQTIGAAVDNRRIFTAATIDSINPSHAKQLVGRVASCPTEVARSAVAAATRAFPSWRDLPAEDRTGYLTRSAAILRRRRFELAAWEVYECGKQWREADADVAEAIDYLEYYAHEMRRLARPQRRNVPGENNETFYEGCGVAVTIAPWNFPLAILCGMTAAALAAGNATIMKPAEQSGVVASKLMEAFEEAGFPAGVVQLVSGIGQEVGPALVGHPDVSVIAFTGSRKVGLSIQELASRPQPGQEHVKRVITEMGGKNATIVDDDADLDEAVHAVAAGAFGYAGQKCSACSRVIVLEAVYEKFLDRLIEVTRSMRVGPAEDPGAAIGPVIDGDARDRIRRTIQSAKAEARLAYAGDAGPLEGKGFYVPPHVFADVAPDSSLAREEIFGPVLSVIRARDLTDAIAIANGTQYALTGGLHSRSPANINRVRRDFRVGNLYINRKITGALVDRQPFGGFKLSGTGPKAGGPDYLPQFMRARTITENSLRHGFAPSETISNSVAQAGE